MTTKVYGASDDLIEFEGDLRGEVNHFGTDEHELFRECLGGESPELYALLNSNSTAVKGATDG